ncbi:uncharacterized protein BDR25DRAFT_362507 [Lindgomyces ingoldianus]|uniref:Uncharacterized protein n=1 Tax=Lindgomyces ingoldianus TaxID=673940 RepID=A0ACB6QC61_9PLEO|nr:uncharacterized protein BDR25DRAFT_362507 [Lindgomyces ingoldianus]KAF2463702.1 hypothetical protein BDR25DRAFT_362507 [Lindgomyces ingoldianus]
MRLARPCPHLHAHSPNILSIGAVTLRVSPHGISLGAELLETVLAVVSRPTPYTASPCGGSCSVIQVRTPAYDRNIAPFSICACIVQPVAIVLVYLNGYLHIADFRYTNLGSISIAKVKFQYLVTLGFSYVEECSMATTTGGADLIANLRGLWALAIICLPRPREKVTISYGDDTHSCVHNAVIIPMTMNPAAFHFRLHLPLVPPALAIQGAVFSLGVTGLLVPAFVYASKASHTRGNDDANGFPNTLPSMKRFRPLSHILSYDNSCLYVLNPYWDTNPFFFELYHLASESEIPIIAYACWSDDGTPYGFLETKLHYIPKIILNLMKAAGKQSQNGNEA